MKTMGMSILLLAVVSGLWADITAHFGFCSINRTYEPIVGTVITGLTADEAISPLDIGFSFNYWGDQFTQVKVSTNGWIGLGTAQNNPQPGNLLSSANFCPVVAPIWDNLSMTDGQVSYLLSGTSPERVLTIQYANAHWDHNAANQANFQVKLYEACKIELCYGGMTGSPSNASASIGINETPGGYTNFYSITPGIPVVWSNLQEDSSNTVFPISGTVYVFEHLALLQNDLEAVSVSADPLLEAGVETQVSVEICNPGLASQDVYQVKLMSGNIELGSIDGSYLLAGLMHSYQFSWVPDSSGVYQLYGKVVLPGDQNLASDITEPLSVCVYPSGQEVVTAGTGDELHRVPLDFNWKYSLYETIYYPEEIPSVGLINGIVLENQFINNIGGIPVQIYLGQVVDDWLWLGWEPADQLTQVVNRNIDFPSGHNQVYIPFDTPFNYTGGKLVMMVHQAHTFALSSTDSFYSQTVGIHRARMYVSDMTDPDPANPPLPVNGQLSGEYPKTNFVLSAVPAGLLFGTVRDSEGQAVNEAYINIPAINRRLWSGGGGGFDFTTIPAGNLEITISKPHYISQTLTFNVLENQANILNIVLQCEPHLHITGRVVRADNPNTGIENAQIIFFIDEEPAVHSNGFGYFAYTSYTLNQNIVYSVYHEGFINLGGIIDEGVTDIDMGNLPMIAYVSISGRVVDATNPGIGIAEANLEITGVDTYSTSSDASGNFLFPNVQPGSSYVITATREGYIAVADTFYLDYANYYIREIAMNPIVGNGEHSDTALLNGLSGCYPNPFNDVTNIKYQVIDAGLVIIRVYNTKGQLVRTLKEQPEKTGINQIIWNGLDNNGNHVSQGVYYIRMQAAGVSYTDKVLLLN